MVTHASTRDLLRWRLTSQGLAGPERGDVGPRGAGAVVERLLAMQAQDYPSACWALGVRSPGLTLSDVERAIDTAEIVRSWPMRGTLHFVPAAELEWMLQLTTTRLLAGTRTRRGQLGLDERTVERARVVAVESLSGSRELTRAGFLAALEAAGIATDGQRGYHLIGHLAQTATLCWGPVHGNRQSLVLLAEWVPRPRRLERDEALGEFVLRYLAGHGPATVKDFAWWSQLTVADARAGLAVAADRLVELEIDGVAHYAPVADEPETLGLPPRQRSPLLALPGFDEYLLGYQNRSATIPDEDFPRVVPGKNGIFLPVMVQNGRIIGTWRKRVGPGTVAIEPKPFGSLTDRQHASLGRAGRDLARFLGATASVG